MQRLASQIRRFLQALMIAMSVALLAIGDAPLAGQASQKSKEKQTSGTREAQLLDLRNRAKSLKAFAVVGPKRIPIKLVSKPLLRFSDPARESRDGAIWAWKSAGRPVALLTLERYKTYMSYEITSLATTGEQLQVVESDGWRWSPRKPGLELKSVLKPPKPAETKVGRLRQMKMLARRFSASEVFLNEKYKLRLLAQPIFRYSDLENGLIDAALFVFAYGTNPEVVIVLECRRENSSQPVWNFGALALSAAQLTVRLDDRVVWTRPASLVRKTQEPYTFYVKQYSKQQ